MFYNTVYQKDKKDYFRGGSLGGADFNISEKNSAEKKDLRVEFIVTACPTFALTFNGIEV
jgi:hypothetical protein